ncbi:MAG: MFS transporter [Candidatus Rokubacteria bacterium]|nr:MFS transporter [Candidatus Rokubacteria bacterium]
MKPRPRATLATAATAHFLHDGLADIVYVLLPVWAAEFRLSFVQVGFIRTAYTGAMALLQIPAGLLAERWGERRFLALGTALTAGGFVALGWWASGFLALLACLVASGAGSGFQHPLSSSIVSRAYEGGGRRAALGTYNFSGDLGKVAASAGFAALVAAAGWRAASTISGTIGLAAAAVILAALAALRQGGVAPAVPAGADTLAARAWGIRDGRGFQALSAVGMIDNATRTGLLTFLPFVLIAKGVSVTGVGVALALVFAGGAIGKFVCGFVAERVGVIRTVVLTEAATALGILTVVASPAAVTLAVLFPLGVALNGTSSVLYATVADLVDPDRRSRAYGLYYTLSIGASAMAPTVYGLVSDAAGASFTLTVVGLVVLVTIPLCLLLRQAVEVPASA